MTVRVDGLVTVGLITMENAMSYIKISIEFKAVIIGLLIGLSIFMKPFYIVRPGFAAMHQRLGKIIGVRRQAGLYFKLPLIDTVTHIDTKICIMGNETTALSKDLQFVSIGVAINYRIADIEHVYNNLGVDFIDTVINPFAAESIKAIVAKYTAEDLIQLRHQAKDAVCADLKARLSVHQIDLVEFNFVHVDFSKAFLHSVEEKQIAQQNALMSKNKTVQIQEEALQSKLKSDAEAYSLQVKKASVTKELIELKKAESFIKAIEKWDGAMPHVLSTITPFLDIGKL